MQAQVSHFHIHIAYIYIPKYITLIYLGTSKAHTMLDYGNKLLEAYQLGKQVQMNAIETILYGKADGGKLGTDLEFDGFGEQPRQISISFENEPIKKVVLYNTLARQRFQIVTLVVNTQYVEVVGPSGEYIQAQVSALTYLYHDF